jgi:hypothetical protein
LTYKDTWNNPKSAIKTENFGVFNKKMRFFFVVSEKTTTFAAHFEKMLCEVRLHLGKEQALCTRFALTLSP